MNSLTFILFLLPTIHSIWNDTFTAYWNVPSERCVKKYNVTFPLDRYNIVYNKGQKFIGDKIVLFYEYKTGLFPYYADYDTQRPVNGGLPQKCNITAHLQMIEEMIYREMPDENFDGPAIFDVEEWRPMYHLNWGKKGVYKTESIRFVQEKFPSISIKSATMIAEEEFNRAARKVLTSTLQLAKRLRPKALWSMYGFPYCNYDAGQTGDLSCSVNFRNHNDRLRWLTDEFVILSPSIYLTLATNNTAANYRFIYSVIREAIRIGTKNNQPVVPYTKFEYNPYSSPEEHIYYSKRDLCNSLKLSSDAGAHGTLVWSTDRHITLNRCMSVYENVDNSLGPAVNLVRRRADRCSMERCSGHGRCVLRRPGEKCTFRLDPLEYNCQCDSSFYGESCERRHHLTTVEMIGGTTTEREEVRTERNEVMREEGTLLTLVETADDPPSIETNTIMSVVESSTPFPLPAPFTIDDSSVIVVDSPPLPHSTTQDSF